ncbi:MAG: hypothetical protein ACYC1C_12155 [Chloroflexota bacterium]
MIGARWALLSLALSIALFVAVPGVSAQATGKVEGTVVNKSAQGGPVSGQTVHLYAYDGNSQKEVGTTTVGTDGKFSFGDLPVDGSQYGLAVQFEGVTYISDAISLSESNPTAQADLTVYSSTTDASALSLSQNHIIVDVDPANKMLMVMEVFVLDNVGDRTYVGSGQATADGKTPTVQLGLVEGASHVSFGDGLSDQLASFTDGKVVDTEAVPPGTKQMIVYYFVPYEQSAATLRQTQSYPVGTLSVVVRDIGAQITAEGLSLQSPIESQGNRYVHYSGTNLAAGTAVSASIAEIPASLPVSTSAGGAISQQTPMIAGGLAALGLALGLVAFPLARRRRSGTVPAPRPPRRASTEWEKLVQEAADLDDDFEAGKVAEEEYRRRRAECKKRLLELSSRTGRR